jgi:hypothetical protein
MNTYKYFINLIPRDLRFFFQMLYYRIKYFPYGSFYFTTREELKQLIKHINLYFYYNATKKKGYCEEIQFLNESNNTSDIIRYVFPYSFVLKYKHESVEVNVDNETGLLYVMHNGKKLFYNRDYITKEGVQRRYNSVCIEQDEKSPHRYLSNTFNMDDSSVVADIGAAEGNFSIEIIDKAKMLYIFESDKKWVEALNKTFEPWKHKVQIVNKYVSNVNNETCITLDSFFNEKTVDFIKLDVEGAEISVLERASAILSRNTPLRLAVCTYHYADHTLLVERMLKARNFVCRYSDGYMLYIYDILCPPYFRRGLIRASK